MHASSLENMAKCVRRYLGGAAFEGREGVEVLDLGGADINGSYRSLFADPKFRYRAADLESGPGVDLVLDDPYRIPAADGAFDVVLSGQMLEHCEYFWRSFREMIRVVADDGFLFLIAPSSGPIHRYPVDCYRFYPDAYRALAADAGCRLEGCWLDERGPWHDLVGVFRKGGPSADRGDPRTLPGPLAVTVPADPADGSIAPASPAEEATAGAEAYLETLDRVHAALRPGLYLEIGVRAGDSLRLAGREAIGVDPSPLPMAPLPPSTTLFRESSDDFFELDADDALGRPVDLAFIDGLHLFEYALRDFMNIERRAAPAGLVVLDDIFPNHPVQGSRHRRTRVWAGDVWRFAACLASERPDLVLLPLDCAPTGLLLVAGLDPSDRTFWERYNPIVRRALDELGDEPPAAILRRDGAFDPRDPIVGELLSTLRRLGERGADADDARAHLDGFRDRCRHRYAA